MKNAVELAKAYYGAMQKKSDVTNFLHESVRFIGPMAVVEGKEKVLSAAHGFMQMYSSLEVHKVFADGDQALVVYEVTLPEPIGSRRAAALVTTSHGLITELELFYDSAPFEKLRQAIFGDQEE